MAYCIFRYLFCTFDVYPKNNTKIGATILAVLKVYMESTKKIAEHTICHFLFCTPAKNNQTPATKKNVATFASNAARDSMICQGEIAKKSAEDKAYSSFDFEFQNILFVKNRGLKLSIRQIMPTEISL